MTNVGRFASANRIFAERNWTDRRRVRNPQDPAWTGIERRKGIADRRGLILAVTCPQCGHVDHMSAASYQGWPDGVKCGICGPPFVEMFAVPSERGS
jgi:ribosomal protein S27E